MNDIHKTWASHTDLKPRFVLVVHSCITCKCSVMGGRGGGWLGGGGGVRDVAFLVSLMNRLD